MKFKSILLLIVALSLLLCACNDATITTEPESAPAPSASEMETLPNEYCIKNGKLRLDLRKFGVTMNVNKLPGQIADRVRFDLTEEQLREKMMALDFTAEELEKINHLVSSGYAYVADPRLIEPLSLPDGCELKSVAMGVTRSA